MSCFDRMSVRSPSLAQAQVDKYSERFLGREESRIRPEDLRVLQLEIFPNPARQGQQVSFRITITNDFGHSGRSRVSVPPSPYPDGTSPVLLDPLPIPDSIPFPIRLTVYSRGSWVTSLFLQFYFVIRAFDRQSTISKIKRTE